MAAEATGEALLQSLGRGKTFNCKLASDGEAFEKGSIYIAPADYHLLVKKETLLVTKGARGKSLPAGNRSASNARRGKTHHPSEHRAQRLLANIVPRCGNSFVRFVVFCSWSFATRQR